MTQARATTSRSGTAIRFPTELHSRLRDAAAERGLSINWLVTRAVEDFLGRLLPLAEIILTRDRLPGPAPSDEETGP